MQLLSVVQDDKDWASKFEVITSSYIFFHWWWAIASWWHQLSNCKMLMCSETVPLKYIPIRSF